MVISERQGTQAKEDGKRKTYKKPDEQYRWMDGILAETGGEWCLGKRSLADTILCVLTRWNE
ncbi:hypothetical protein RM533_13190 [Croceicoccus sp. F390]|uniref:Transposase n=1 Tax=Croceicoccus esteveae TaxID=3075597 RepID=A0ABU2ZKI3_9SPHN|nr:hypothetical protein [Croceicoccus sp. F390]MDT0577121.1 hypothetical protein [Croceicoccus sp. F390]